MAMEDLVVQPIKSPPLLRTLSMAMQVDGARRTKLTFSTTRLTQEGTFKSVFGVLATLRERSLTILLSMSFLMLFYHSNSNNEQQ